MASGRRPGRPPGDPLVVGVFVPREPLDGMVRLERRYQEAFQISTGRETLETLPQSTFLFLTLLTLFAAVWTGLAIARTISEPVRALAKAAQRVGRGDLEVSLPEQGEDELALLSRSLQRHDPGPAAEPGRPSRPRPSAWSASGPTWTSCWRPCPVGVLSWQADGDLRTFNSVARRWFGRGGLGPLRSPLGGPVPPPRAGRLPDLLAAGAGDRRPASRRNCAWAGKARDGPCGPS